MFICLPNRPDSTTFASMVLSEPIRTRMWSGPSLSAIIQRVPYTNGRQGSSRNHWGTCPEERLTCASAQRAYPPTLRDVKGQVLRDIVIPLIRMHRPKWHREEPHYHVFLQLPLPNTLSIVMPVLTSKQATEQGITGFLQRHTRSDLPVRLRMDEYTFPENPQSTYGGNI